MCPIKTNEIVDDFKNKFSRVIATLIIAKDSEDRHFIGEALLLSALLFVLEIYCAGFFSGMGLQELSESHGRRARKLLEKIKMNLMPAKEVEAKIENTISELSNYNINSTVKSKAELEVIDVLLKHGATKEQAKDTASLISSNIFN